MVNPHLEKIFMHCILGNSQYIDATKYEFFDDQTIKKVFKVAKTFYNKYKETPTVAQMQELVKMEDLDVTSQQVETLWNVDLKEYDETWLKENTETFIEYKNLDLSAVEMVNFLKVTTISSDNIKDVVSKAKDIITSKNNINFEFSAGSDFSDPDAHKQLTYNTFSSGYTFLDTVSDGGWSAGTLTVFVGQPKIGKSLWLGNLAAQAVKDGHNVGVVSLEMAEHKYMKRIGSNLLNIKIGEYKNKANDREFIKKAIRNMSMGDGMNLTLPGRLMIKSFPTSTASTQDIEHYLLQTEQKLGIKFKVVIIDYLNIMKNWRNPNTENTYMKIKQIAEDTRAMAQRNDWAIISATQTKQSAFDESDMAMNAVSESSGLVATVDLMYAIIQTPTMLTDSVYKLKVLANRDEGYKNFVKTFAVTYPYMRITETAEPMYDSDAGFNTSFKKK